jgi:hypothetical protein
VLQGTRTRQAGKKDKGSFPQVLLLLALSFSPSLLSPSLSLSLNPHHTIDIMQLRRSLLALMGALSLAAAHFEVTHPPARTSGSHDAISFPCGGQTVSANRFAVPLDNPQLSLGMTMGHDQAALQVLLGLGNDPGSNFNISVLPLMRQVGLGDLCLPNVRLSETVLGVAPTDGMNATLQVVTNGDPSGGLYNVSFLSLFLYFLLGTC